ncbi:Bifunctional transcriptional activator/DNA repair enzyme Ada [uncultured Defluviicoccus sp.]|uniref:methylated-DNA--[protein]-cysteine S-methyltransferase n=1 Tax=metagenome TaxID=256318 RepID=A0A380TGK4_9ZZZZ|nr:Bifunctional transcriptional activator/DNA repair enzyme Ada [uncultured Defluviicoccus sp.]
MIQPEFSLATSAQSLPTPRTMYRALSRRDAAYEGVFFTGVKTTGIFCRPTCRAKRPHAENVEFFPTVTEALHGGYRPCRLCRPMDGTKPVPPLVERLRRAAESAPDGRVTDKDLVAMGVEPSTARRQFKAYHGMTFHAYQRARRMGLALRDVQTGKPVIDVQLGRGYESTSGFREAFARVFGTPPRGAKDAVCLLARRIETPLGTMLALADDAGLRLLEFVDRRGLERELAGLRRRLKCAIVPGGHAILDQTATELTEYFAGKRTQFDVPLAPVGSAFQLRVWAELGRIPSGRTRSYAEMAQRLGIPKGPRAIGRANGSNMLAIVIPCHRVINADGTLCGYAGGLWRKQRLLELERKGAGSGTTARER